MFISKGLTGFFIALFFGCVLLILGACQSSPQNISDGDYFDLEGLVENQIVLLEATKPEVEKHLALNGDEEIILTNEVNWKDELSFFVQADISKPSLRDSYSVDRSDANSEMYRLKEGLTHSVKELKVVYSETTGEVQEVFAIANAENRLFDTSRLLKLTMSGEQEKNRIVSYEIRNVQKMAFSEEKTFEIKGLIK